MQGTEQLSRRLSGVIMLMSLCVGCTVAPPKPIHIGKPIVDRPLPLSVNAAILPDGSRAYVAVGGVVGVISADTNQKPRAIALIPHPGTFTIEANGASPPLAAAIALLADGVHAYVPEEFGRLVWVIDTSRDAVEAILPLQYASTPTVYTAPIATTSADGQRVYVTDPGNDLVVVIDPTTNTIVKRIGVGIRPLGLAIAPDDRSLYVVGWHSRGATATIAFVDNATDKVIATLPLGRPNLTRSLCAAVSPFGNRLYVSGADATYVIDTAHHSVVTVIRGVFGSVALSPDGKRAYVGGAWGGDVQTIDTATEQVTAITPLPVNVSGIAVSADGRRVYGLQLPPRPGASFAVTTIPLRHSYPAPNGAKREGRRSTGAHPLRP